MGLFDRDFQDFIKSLNKYQVDYVLIGGHAVNLHGRYRTTEDLDIFVGSTAENAIKLFKAIDDFGFDLSPLKEHLEREKKLFKDFIFSQNIKLPTSAGPIEILGKISGIRSYEETKLSSREVEVEGLKFSLISKQDLIKNKIAAGREKDLLDVKLLGQVAEEKKQSHKVKQTIKRRKGPKL